MTRALASVALIAWLTAGTSHASRPLPTSDPLVLAVKAGDHQKVERMLARGRDANTTGEGWALLHFAAWQGDLRMVHLLLAKGAKRNPRTHSGEERLTPLHLAAMGGHRAVADLLIAKGADLGAKSHREQLIHYAARGGQVWLIELCLKRDRGALHAAGSRGQTPLHIAAQYDRPKAISFLAKRGAKLEARRSRSFGETPLHDAATAGAARAVEALHRLGAALDARTEGGWTALHQAVYRKHAKVARYLIRAKVNLDVETNDRLDYHGWRAIHFAFSTEQYDLARELILAGAEIKAGISVPGPTNPARVPTKWHTDSLRGWTPLHFAASADRVELVKLLLERGASPTVKDVAGHSPLDVASEQSRRLLRAKLRRRRR